MASDHFVEPIDEDAERMEARRIEAQDRVAENYSRMLVDDPDGSDGVVEDDKPSGSELDLTLRPNPKPNLTVALSGGRRQTFRIKD